jgi:exopolyphosphatase/guanosine-5'-triphosphate,3'-diphosphate pyrophosphatase
VQFAALDIGSNTVKLLVVDPDKGGGHRASFDHAVVSRLSEGLQASGRLSDEAMVRTIDVIEGLFREAGRSMTLPLVAVVTAPGRRASNGRAFVDLLRERTGIKAEIASADQEAGLSLLATQRAFPEENELLMIDLGGASTEWVHSRGGDLVSSVSIDLGSVRLTEGYLPGDPPEAAVIDAARTVALEAFDGEARTIRQNATSDLATIFVSGTATTLASLHLDLPAYDAERVHGLRLTADDISTICRRLATTRLAEKRLMKAMDPARADVILGGAILVEVILEALGLESMRVSDRGARWGLIPEH